MSDSSRYDAIVVGAGPAGAAAAITLARGGARVALVDRARFPRDKPCGDLLGRAAVAQCRILGVDLAALGAFRVRGVDLRTPGGSHLHGIALRGARAGEEACTLPRYRFDAALVALAVDAGAAFVQLQATGVARDGCRVVGVRARRDGVEGQGPSAPLVIAADGWGSAIARELLGEEDARPAQRGVAARCYVEGVRDLHGAMRFLVERDLLPGCAWIFPLGGDRANVGLGTIVPPAPPPRRAAGAPPGVDGTPARPARRLAALLAARGSAAWSSLEGARQAGPIETWPLAIGWRRAPVAFDGVLLAGDAASLVSPLSGSGIAAALHSGRLAGACGLLALARGDTSLTTLDRYERAVARAFRRRYRLERLGQSTLYHAERLDTLGRLAGFVPYSQAIAGGLLFNLG